MLLAFGGPYSRAVGPPQLSLLSELSPQLPAAVLQHLQCRCAPELLIVTYFDCRMHLINVLLAGLAGCLHRFCHLLQLVQSRLRPHLLGI